MSPKVAIITGGSSGLGYEVCESLSKKGDWEIHNVDLNAPSTTLPNTTFHKCDITNDQELGNIFSIVHATQQRLDFVFANAGVGGRPTFYNDVSAHKDGTTGALAPPPLPVESMHLVVNINLNATTTTTYLAAYYMQHSPPTPWKCIVITASAGGLYPTIYIPIYGATKHAVVGFMQGVAPFYYKQHGIRVNAICLGAMKTNIGAGGNAPPFTDDVYTPLEKAAAVVDILIEGKDDGSGKVGERGSRGTGRVEWVGGGDLGDKSLL